MVVRNRNAAADLRIRAKTQKNLTDQLKELIRAHGRDPEQVLTREAPRESSHSRRPGKLLAAEAETDPSRIVHQEINEVVKRKLQDREFQVAKRDRWDLNPRSSGLTANERRSPMSYPGCPRRVAVLMRSRLRSRAVAEVCLDKN